MRRCRVCGLERPESDFYLGPKTQKPVKRRECRFCACVRTRIWTLTHPTNRKTIMRKHDLKRKYGIDEQIYNAILATQNGLCAICGTPPSAKDRWSKLAVDHRHNDGQIRGLLCTRCNFAIGLFRERPDLFGRAVRYLAMEIGPIRKTVVVTPLENPVPQPQRIPDTLPIEITQPEREKVPA